MPDAEYEVEMVKPVTLHQRVRIRAVSPEIARFRATNGDGQVVHEWAHGRDADPWLVVTATRLSDKPDDGDQDAPPSTLSKFIARHAGPVPIRIPRMTIDLPPSILDDPDTVVD